MAAWLNDKRPYERRHKQGWQSSILDFRYAVRRVGPELANALSKELAQCSLIAQSLLTEVASKTPAGFRAMLVAQQVANRTAFETLLIRLTDPHVRIAAWKDVASVCHSSTKSYEELARLRDLFWAVMQTGHYNPLRVATKLGGVLGDNAFEILSTRVALGDIDISKIATHPQPGESAGLDEGSRLSLCERLLAAPSKQAHHVVWLAFQNAYLHRMGQEVGVITFYDAHWIRSCLETRGSFPNEFPAELRDEDSLFRLDFLPEERATVLARIDLGANVFADPVQVAREQAEAVVALAGFRAGGSRWGLLQGYLHAIDGRVAAMGAFMLPRDIDSLPRSPEFDPTSDYLMEIETDLAPHLPVSNPDLLEIIDAVHAWQDASKQEPLSSIILYVRILELVAARVGYDRWFEYVDDYFAAAWVREAIYRTLHVTVYEAAFTHIEGLSDSQKQEKRELQLSIFRSKSYGHDTDLGKALKAMPTFVGFYPLHHRLTRKVEGVTAQLSSSATITTLRDELDERWGLARSRLQRIRNALAHGGPIEVESANTVHHLAEQLAAWSLHLSLRGILNGRGIAVELDAHKDNASAWFDGVPSASDAERTLFRG